MTQSCGQNALRMSFRRKVDTGFYCYRAYVLSLYEGPAVKYLFENFDNVPREIKDIHVYNLNLNLI